jgi:hypothetical protein
MRINEIIREASRGERERQRRLRADQQRAAQQSARDAEDARTSATLQRMNQKKMDAFKAVPTKQDRSSGAFSDPRFDQYRVDTSVDSDFSDGYYLSFDVELDGVTAYWSKGDLSISQAAQFKQIQSLGNKFNPALFQRLVDELILRSSRGDQRGYVHISFSRRYINHPFFYSLYEYLLQHYPRDDHTVDAHVAWELEP